MIISFNDVLLLLIENQPYIQNKGYKADIKTDTNGTSVIFDEIHEDDMSKLRVDLTVNGFSHVYLRTRNLIKKEDANN